MMNKFLSTSDSSFFLELVIISHSRFEMLHLFFSGVQISSDVSVEPPSKSPQGFSIIIFILHFYLIILLSPEFFMVVLHDLIHSSRVHQDLVGGVQVYFLLAS